MTAEYLAILTDAEAIRVVAICDQVNAHVSALIAQHGPAIERAHPYRNDGLDCLSLDDLEFMTEIAERWERQA